MSGVPGSRLTAYMAAHIDSPLQHSYDDDVEQKYLDHAQTLHDNVMSYGVTMRPEPGSKPLEVEKNEWYGVGGATDPRTGKRFPETIYNFGHASQQFNRESALQHVLRTEGMNIDRAAGRTPSGRPWGPAYAGGWNEETPKGRRAVLDYSDVYYGRRGRSQAVKKGIERGERAVFDAKNLSEIRIKGS